ncbi:MAG TPA: hypothetical protein VFS76_21900 [Pyrinomonadaceae bacterium]|nr:hypothetical protein [Pyrinomonadaceae bacterium]
MRLTTLTATLVVLFSVWTVSAQTQTSTVEERRVSLNEVAVAHDAEGASALEATLRTTELNGSSESPVTNVRVVIKNSSTISFAFVSGVITFYDNAGVRCGEGIFKADTLATGESFETDTPGLRIRCQPATWRVAATNLVPRMAPNPTAPPISLNYVITIDGEAHPIQLDKPMVLTLGERRRTIVVRTAQ